MDKLFFSVNIGSASKKISLYQGIAPIFHAHFEREDSGFVVTLHFFSNGAARTEKRPVTEDQFRDAVEYAYGEAVAQNLVHDQAGIAAIGFRIVAPGAFFREHRLINDEYLRRLEAARVEDPLHLGMMITEFGRIRSQFKTTPIVGVSDSAFHSTMPPHARAYALPEAVRTAQDIERFGYHGLSIASVVAALRAPGPLPEHVIVCHLGSGSSIVALKNGESVDTSMGFSPLEGIPMATRIGDIDAGAVVQLARSNVTKDFAELEEFLYTKCGLLGLSGKTDDMRQLIELEKNSDEAAHLAIEVFVYRIRKYIGAYLAALGGLDLLVFSGTIGERSFYIRSRIVSGLSPLGITLDDAKNTALDGDKAGNIEASDSHIPVRVILANEAQEIARATAEVAKL